VVAGKNEATINEAVNVKEANNIKEIANIEEIHFTQHLDTIIPPIFVYNYYNYFYNFRFKPFILIIRIKVVFHWEFK